MSRGRAGTVSKAQRRVVLPGRSALNGEGSPALYRSGGHRIPSLCDGEARVLPGRHTNPSETPLFLENGPDADFLGFGSGELYGGEASASSTSIPTSMGWAGCSCTSRAGQGPPGDPLSSTPGAEGLQDQPAGAHLPWDKAPGHPCQK